MNDSKFARLRAEIAETTVGRRRRMVIAAVAMLCGTGLATPALAQGYPTKSIRIVDGYSAGGGTDVLVRLITPKLSEVLGYPVVVENRPGASGTIAANEVAQSTDQHTLLMGVSSTVSVLPTLRPDLPYNTARDLVAIGSIATFQSVLVVPKTSPYKTVVQIISAARAQPGKLNYASGGPATANHLSAELFKSMARVDITHIPYKGGAPALTAILAGEVDMLFATLPAATAHIKNGTLNAIAVTGPKRSAEFPELPTVAESGLKGFEVVTWTGLLMPSKTPKHVVEQLNRALNQVLRDPAIQASIAARSSEVAISTPEEFTQLIRHDTDQWATVIREAGIKLE